MAVLNSTQLAELRRAMASDQATVNYNKVQINAALQAVEDWFEANRAAINAAINTATAPLVFTGSQKSALVKYWLRQKFERGG